MFIEDSGTFEERFEVDETERGRVSHLFCIKRGHHHHLSASPRDRYIQALLAATLSERPKVHRHGSTVGSP